MWKVARSGRRIRARASIYVASSAAISAVLPTLCSSAQAQVALSENSNTNWTINNGPLTVIFDPSAEDITSIKLNSGGTTSSNLLGGSTPELDQEFAGTPFGSGPQTFNAQVGPNNSYVDVWTNVASTGTTVNPITYAFHYVLFANDPTVYCLRSAEPLGHRSGHQRRAGPVPLPVQSEPLSESLSDQHRAQSARNRQRANDDRTFPAPMRISTTVTAQAGRTVQNVTYDLTGSGIAGDNGTNFFTKYDYSVYTQFFQAETMYGSNYAVTEVDPLHRYAHRRPYQTGTRLDRSGNSQHGIPLRSLRHRRHRHRRVSRLCLLSDAGREHHQVVWAVWVHRSRRPRARLPRRSIRTRSTRLPNDQ